MVKEYEYNEIFNNNKDNPFCIDLTVGIFGLLKRIQNDTSNLEKKLSNSTYVWIEEINDEN